MIKSKWNFPIYSFSQPLKEMCKQGFCLTDYDLNDIVQKEKVVPTWALSPRKIMNKLDSDCVRKCFGQDHFVHLMRARLRSDGSPFVVIDDVQSANEFRFVQEQGGVVIRVVRDSAVHDKRLHVSGTEQARMMPELLLNNTFDLSQLQRQCDEVMITTFDCFKQTTTKLDH